MTFGSIFEKYLESLKLPNGSIDAKQSYQTLALTRFSEILPELANARAIKSDLFREVLSRRYVEEATLHGLRDGVDETEELEPGAFLDTLCSFFEWAHENRVFQLAANCLEVLTELRQSIPRAIKIGVTLSKEITARGDATIFPEFLTSFEQGGASRYDIDSPDGQGVIEGYFRIRRVENLDIEAEEIITEEVVWPIEFPPVTARLLSEGFLINLEIVRESRAWRIAGCGFAYPPGTDI
jgi:hypothetical protein